MFENGLAQQVRFRSELVPKLGSRLTASLLLLVGIGIAFLLWKTLASFGYSDAQFDRTRIAELQVAAASRIAEDIRTGAPAPTLASSLHRYRNLLDEEAGFLTADMNALALHREDIADAERMETLARARRKGSELRNFATSVVSKKQAGAAQARNRLAEARNRTASLATLLGVVAIVAAAGGSWLFLRYARRLEALVRERTAEIEEVDRSRRLFFAKASHELRTPVTAIRGEAEVALADRAGDIANMRLSLEHVLANAEFLGHRIEEMIGLARTADGKLHLESDRLDLRDIIQGAALDSKAFAASVEVSLRIRLPDSGVAIIGDAQWLRRALLAIIENALKFSPMNGMVDVELRAEPSIACIRITDEGPGIPAEELPLIFEAYYQTEDGRMRGGSGLGLALARWVIEQHGGTAKAANIGNLARNGCCMTVTFPFGNAA